MADTIEGINPTTGQPTGSYVHETAAADVRLACRRAAETARLLSSTSRLDRTGWLATLADALVDHRDELIAAAAEETGLPTARLHGEIERTAYQLRLFAEAVIEGSLLEVVIDHPGDTPMGPRPDLRRMLIPIGPVAVFSASNFPFAFSVLGGDTASALAAGCPVIVKGHPSHPHTSSLTFDLALTALRGVGAPDHLLQIVHGVEPGIDLVQDRSIKAVAFTGSTAGGQSLAALAAGRDEPIPFYGELSGINPIVVTSRAIAADLAGIARGLADSVTMGSGQFCTKPGLVLVPSRDADAFTSALVDNLANRPAMVALNRGIATAYQERRDLLTQLAGVTVHDPASEPAPPSPGFWLHPTVLTADAAGLNGELLEECFGPLVVISPYETRADLDAALNRIEGSLTATLHAAEGDDVASLAGTLAERSGRLVWNGFPTGVAVSWAMSHGGPSPATTNSLHTSVGMTATRRFMRPVTYQDWPMAQLPPELRDDYTTIPRRIDGILTGPTG